MGTVIPKIHLSFASTYTIFIQLERLVVALLCLSLCSALVSMLCRVEHVNRELEEQGSLENDRHFLVKCRWEGNEDAGLVEVSSILIPAFALFVSLLGSRTLLQGQARHKHQECGQEDRANNTGEQCSLCAALDIIVRSRGHCKHEDGCTDVSASNRLLSRYNVQN